MLDRIMSSTRFVVLLGVIASVVLSAALFIVATIRTFMMVADALMKASYDKTAKSLAIAAIEQADVFLIATAILIVGIGLHELFIGEVSLPKWLLIKSIDDLKDKLINVVVVVLAVNFLADVAEWDGKTDLLNVGLGIGVVILSLTAFGALRLFKVKDKSEPE